MFVNPLFHVFIDETGNVMEGQGDSPLYICTAVFVSDENKQKVEDGLNIIKEKYKIGSILKSNQISKNHERRIAILKELMELDFTFYYLITDKTKILKDSPLSYKKTRYKYLHKILNKHIVDMNYNLNIVIDNYGTEEFRNECLKYYDKMNTDLFCGEVNHSYADDKDQSILQISDFIGGTLLYSYDKDKNLDKVFFDQIRAVIHKKEIGHDFFPRGQYPTIPERPLPNSQIQDQLWRHLYNLASRCIGQLEDSDNPLEIMQYYTLKSLFYARNFESPENQWIFSDELIENLKNLHYDITKRAFTVSVIGGLREKKILIAGSQMGYKLALNLDDIKDYLEHDSNIIFPMLRKLQSARGLINTLIQYDIFNGKYELFDDIIAAFSSKGNVMYTSEPDIESMSFLEDELVQSSVFKES